MFHLSRGVQAVPEISGVENELFLPVHPRDGAVVCVAAILHLILCPSERSSKDLLYGSVEILGI